MDYSKLVKMSVLLVAFYLTSFQWPVQSPRITSTWGESRGDHLHDGVDLISYSKKVYPVEDGVLLYAWNHAYFPFENYSGSGNYMVISHGKFASVYMHLDDQDFQKNSYGLSDIIGDFSNTGRSYGAHIHFGIFNSRTWESYNYFNFLAPENDTTAPVIDHLAFHIDGKYIRVNDGANIRLTKHFPLLINMFDTIKDGDRFGVYSFRVEANGKIVQEITFDSAKLEKNKLTVEGKPVHTLYDSKYYKVENITYLSGVNEFTVYATDYSGNISQKKFTLNIKLDM